MIRSLWIAVLSVLFFSAANAGTITQVGAFQSPLNLNGSYVYTPTWPSDATFGYDCTSGPGSLYNERSGGDISLCRDTHYTDSFKWSDEYIERLAYNLTRPLGNNPSGNPSPLFFENKWEHGFHFVTESSYKDAETSGTWVERNYDVYPALFYMDASAVTGTIEVDDIATFTLTSPHAGTVKASVIGICTGATHGTNGLGLAGVVGSPVNAYQYCTDDTTRFGSDAIVKSRCDPTASCTAETPNGNIWLSKLTTVLDDSSLCGPSHGPNGGESGSPNGCPTSLAQVQDGNAVAFSPSSASLSAATAITRSPAINWRIQQDNWENEQNTFRGYKSTSLFNKYSMLAYDERGVAIAGDGNQIGAKLHVQNGNSLFSISMVGKDQLAGASTFINSYYDLNAETAAGDGTWDTGAFTNTSCGNVLCSIAQLVDIDLTASDQTYMGQTTGLQYSFDITDPGGTAGSIAYGSHTVASYNIDLGDNASNKPSVTGLNFTKPLGYVNKQSGTHNFNWIAFQDQTLGCYPTASITGATQASPVVITNSGTNSFENGEVVEISGVGGMVELNGNTYTVANRSDTTFQLSGVNGTGYTTYTSGGTATGEADADCGLQGSNHNLIVVQNQSGPGKAGNFYFADTEGVQDSGHLSFGSPKVHLGYNDKGKTLEVYTPATDRCSIDTDLACSDDGDCPGAETCDSGGGSSTPSSNRTYMMVLAVVSPDTDPGGTECDPNRPTLYIRTGDDGNEGLWICTEDDGWTPIGS